MLRVASSEDITSWSRGNITDPEIGKEHEGFKDKGLFSQPIFGPLEDFTCKCGRSVTPSCLTCKVPFGPRTLRRERMGHIELACPVLNSMFLEPASLLLGLSVRELQSLLKNEPRISFDEKGDALPFIASLLKSSKAFAGALGSKLLEAQDLRTIQEELGDPRQLQRLFSGKSLAWINALLNECLHGLSGVDIVRELFGLVTKYV